MGPEIYRAAVVEWARAQRGLRETGGHNRGPEIDAWLTDLGVPVGQPWCAAFACRALRVPGAKLEGFRPGAKVTTLAKRLAACRVAVPVPGAVYCHDSGEGYGHCGIVVDWQGGGTFVGVEGNTNERGEREGTTVRERPRSLDYADLGFFDPALLLASDDAGDDGGDGGGDGASGAGRVIAGVVAALVLVGAVIALGRAA